MISAENAPYQSCYCEENVYKLIEQVDDREELYAVLISSKEKLIMLWNQKTAKTLGGPVIWDYHVIAVQKTETGVKVYDKDSGLAWGANFKEFWAETMKKVPGNPPADFDRKFRVIPADLYLSLLSSDRSHMKNKQGVFLKPPPEWPLINPQNPSNLMELLDFSVNFKDTMVMDEQQMLTFFAK